MNFLVDFLPIVVFYVTYKFVNLYFATGVAIAMTVVMLAWMKLTGRQIEPMRWASLVIIVVFGGATLLFQDETGGRSTTRPQCAGGHDEESTDAARFGLEPPKRNVGWIFLPDGGLESADCLPL
jgi:hypothetical protein